MNVLDDAWAYLTTWSNWTGDRGMLHLLTQQLLLTVTALAIALVIGLPVALWLGHLGRGGFLAINISNIGRAVPTFALLAILVRSMLEGLRGVPDEVVESARGLGYGAGRLLFRVELPLALPVIMAGLRVATVSTVALTTVGSLVAYGGLGNLIKDGVNTNFRAELFTAAVLCVLLAVALDALIVLTQWLLTPWTHGNTG